MEWARFFKHGDECLSNKGSKTIEAIHQIYGSLKELPITNIHVDQVISVTCIIRAQF